jgi:hypothetical protein
MGKSNSYVKLPEGTQSEHWMVCKCLWKIRKSHDSFIITISSLVINHYFSAIKHDHLWMRTSGVPIGPQSSVGHFFLPLYLLNGHDSGTDLLEVPTTYQAQISGNIPTKYGPKYGTNVPPFPSLSTQLAPLVPGVLAATLLMFLMDVFNGKHDNHD